MVSHRSRSFRKIAIPSGAVTYGTSQSSCSFTPDVNPSNDIPIHSVTFRMRENLAIDRCGSSWDAELDQSWPRGLDDQWFLPRRLVHVARSRLQGPHHGALRPTNEVAADRALRQQRLSHQ